MVGKKYSSEGRHGGWKLAGHIVTKLWKHRVNRRWGWI